jgi:hypothetical protein
MFRRGYRWIAFDPKTGEWDVERRLAEAAGLDPVAWTYVDSASSLSMLHAAVLRWGCHAVCPNIEIRDGGAGSTRDRNLMVATLVVMSHVGKGMFVTDGWADPAGSWTGYKRWTGGVEIFPEQDRRLTDLQGCTLHADAFFKQTVPMLGAYGTSWLGRKPTLHDYQALPRGLQPGEPWTVFAADDVEDWDQW